ncbi:MAG: PP2C family protein-serine/threonine phosphatase [Mycobacteriales bacterium]
MNTTRSTGDRVLGMITERSSLTAPDDVPDLVAEHARMLGALETVLYRVDYEQVSLIPLTGKDVPEREPLTIDATLGGRAFRLVQVLEQEADGCRRLWIPLIDGTERVGVMEVNVERIDGVALTQLRQLAAVAADLVLSKSQYGDNLELARRRKPMSLAAEIHWHLLPPLTFGTERVVISGVLEPAYEVGGDAFDYAVNGDTTHLAVFDAMGHGLEASLLSAVAVGAYRSARRRLLDLETAYAEMDDAVRHQFGSERFVTGMFAQLNLSNGRLRWVNAGHPPPLLVRRGRVVKSLECSPSLPLGLGGSVVELTEESLERGDRVLFYTDGVVEARSTDGEFFGQRRLADMLGREAASGQPAPETMRRLSLAVMDHQGGALQDDATMLLLEWLGGQESGVVL